MCPVDTDKNLSGNNAEDKVQVNVKADAMLDCVRSFFYLGDVSGTRGEAGEACRNRRKKAWMSFNKLGRYNRY